MARLPDDSYFGVLAAPQSGRPIATIDQGGYARGAAALAQGVKDIGSGLASAGKDVAAVGKLRRAERDHLEWAKADAHYLIQRKRLDDQLAQEPDPDQLAERYQPLFEKLHGEASGRISDPHLRELWSVRRSPELESTGAAVKARAQVLLRQRDASDVLGYLDEIKTIVPTLPAGPARVQWLDTANALFGALPEGFERAQLSRSWAEDLAQSSLRAMPPDERMKTLDAAGEFTNTGSTLDFIPVERRLDLRREAEADGLQQGVGNTDRQAHTDPNFRGLGADNAGSGPQASLTDEHANDVSNAAGRATEFSSQQKGIPAIVAALAAAARLIQRLGRNPESPHRLPERTPSTDRIALPTDQEAAPSQDVAGASRDSTAPLVDIKPEQKADLTLRLRVAFEQAARRAPQGPDPVRIGIVTSEGAARINAELKAVGYKIDVTGFDHVADLYAARHAYNEHGDAVTEARRDQLPITADDWAMIPNILMNPDRVAVVSPPHARRLSLGFWKKTNGHILYVEEVRTGTRTLAAKTMWKTRAD